MARDLPCGARAGIEFYRDLIDCGPFKIDNRPPPSDPAPARGTRSRPQVAPSSQNPATSKPRAAILRGAGAGLLYQAVWVFGAGSSSTSKNQNRRR